jgi:hypothetical protein
MVSRHRALTYLKTELMRNFSDLRNFLIMIKPASESDREWINTMIDMMDQLMSDIKESEELSDLSDWFNLGPLVEDWDQIESNIARDYSSDVNNLIKMICNQYDLSSDEYFKLNPGEE